MSAHGTVWEIRYRVLGPSTVWPAKFVCEIVTGPDAGQKVVLDAERFSGEPAGEDKFGCGLAPVTEPGEQP